MSQSEQYQKAKLIEILTLEFADAAYRKSSPSGRARKSAFSAFANSLGKRHAKWSSSVEDPRKVFVLSFWEPGIYDADRSFSTVVKPLTTYLSRTQWSRQLVVLDPTSEDITSPLWGRYSHELRTLDFRLPDGYKQEEAGYWKEQEENISKALDTVRNSLTSWRSISSMPPAVVEVGYMGIVGGWVVAEDGATSVEGSGGGEGDMNRRRWAGIFGWRDESCERKAWGEDGVGEGQACLQSLGSLADGVGERWHATPFEMLGDGDPRFQFSSSDEDDS